MLARAYGQKNGLTDRQLIKRAADAGGPTLKGGTGIGGMVRIGEWLDLPTRSNAHRPNQVRAARRQVKHGYTVVALGDSYALPWRWNPKKHEGHFIVLTEMTQRGRFQVRDPADKAEPNGPRTLTPLQLRRFIQKWDGSTLRVG